MGEGIGKQKSLEEAATNRFRGTTIDTAMTPFALSLLGVGPTPAQRRLHDLERALVEEGAELPGEARQVLEPRPVRSSRNRATSYYNSFQTVCSSANDDPPTYDTASRQRIPQRHPQYLRETLPGYTCTVEKSAKVLIQLESISPLHEAMEGEWREVHLVLRGTLLSFHKVKDNGPGKLLRSYTLQHAEVGLALDTQHTVLVPQTRLARLMPSSARRRAMHKDLDMFKEVSQNLLRLRVETDQIVVAHAAQEQIHDLIYSISAGIDIAHAIDERSVPRFCTVPRRRRRPRASQNGDITDPIVVAEQERILREMYPAFAEQTPEPQSEQERPLTNTVQTPGREEDDLDLAAMREDAGSGGDDPSRRPQMTRNTTSSSVNSAYSADMMYATLPTNFNIDGKWEPQNARTPQQIQRYIRRCMPVLLAEAIRASDVLIYNGQRVKIDWRNETLDDWQLQPPSYRSHHFDFGLDLERTNSQRSATESVPQESDNPHTSTSDLGDDHIARAETGLAALDLSKSAVLSAIDKGLPREAISAPKQQPPRHPGQDIHGVVFCF